MTSKTTAVKSKSKNVHDKWGQEQIKALDAMRKTFDKFGWIQNEEGSEECGFCLLGAKQYVYDKNNLNLEGGILSYATTKLGKTHSYVSYNDSVAKNVKDIYKVLTEAKKAVPKFVAAQKLRDNIEKSIKEFNEFKNGYEFDELSDAWDDVRVY